MRIQSIRQRTLLVIPLRFGLGLVWLAGAGIAGAGRGPALIAFALGLVGLAFAALNDRRGELMHRDPEQLPVSARLDPRWRHALAALFPSTFGVSVLAAVALAFEPVLTALLGGASAGLGLAALLVLPGVDGELYVEPRTRSVYRSTTIPPCRTGA